MWKTLAVLILLMTLVMPAQQAAALEVDNDLLALVAMPLAVAAVSEITDVPVNDLMDFVTLLNDANVPPPQFIEVVRYVPVALVVEPAESQPRFIEVVREREQAGVRGPALVTFIEQRFNTYGLPRINLTVTAPRVYVVDQDFVPAVVRTRVVEVRAHPHGGPPGQLKKQAVTTRVVTRKIDDNDHDAKKQAKKIKESTKDDREKRVVKENKPKKQHESKHEGKDKSKGNHKGKGKG